jgi:hypothetical protein
VCGVDHVRLLKKYKCFLLPSDTVAATVLLYIYYSHCFFLLVTAGDSKKKRGEYDMI